MSAYASLPPLVRLYLRSVVNGVWLAMVFVGALLWADVGGLGRLVLAAPEGALAVAMLVIFNAIVFSGVQFGIRIMLMAEDENSGPGGGHLSSAALVPQVAAVPARPARRSHRPTLARPHRP